MDAALALLSRFIVDDVARQLGFVEYDAVRSRDDLVTTLCVFETPEQAERAQDTFGAFERILARAGLRFETLDPIAGEVVAHRAGRRQPLAEAT
jgi:hypothetical protein